MPLFGGYFCRFVEKTAFYYPCKINFLANLLPKNLHKLESINELLVVIIITRSIKMFSGLREWRMPCEKKRSFQSNLCYHANPKYP